MHYVLKRSIFPQITLKCLRLNLHSLCQKSADGHDFNGYFTNFHNICIYIKRVHISPKVRLYYVKYLIWDQFSQQLWKMITPQKCEKSTCILNKQVSNELASQIVIFPQWSDIQKGYSKTRDYSQKSDFSVVADAHAHRRDTRVPLPTLTRNGQLKKYAELFEKKSGWWLRRWGAGYVFLQSWFECDRAKISIMAPGLWPGEDACYPIWYRCLTKTKRILFSELCSAQCCHRLG